MLKLFKKRKFQCDDITKLIEEFQRNQAAQLAAFSF